MKVTTIVCCITLMALTALSSHASAQSNQNVRILTTEATPRALNVENRKPFSTSPNSYKIEISVAPAGWLSSQWIFEPAPGYRPGSYFIKNVWLKTYVKDVHLTSTGVREFFLDGGTSSPKDVFRINPTANGNSEYTIEVYKNEYIQEIPWASDKILSAKSDLVSWRLEGYTPPSVKEFKVGNTTIWDGMRIKLNVENIILTALSLPGSSGSSALIGVPNDNSETAKSALKSQTVFTVEVLDPINKTIKLFYKLPNGTVEFLTRASYWSGLENYRDLSYYTSNPDAVAANLFGIFTVGDAKNGIFLADQGHGLSRFCCVPGGFTNENIIVTRFSDPVAPDKGSVFLITEIVGE